MFASDFFLFVIIIINSIFIDKRYEFKTIIMKRADQIESSYIILNSLLMLM